MSGFVMPEGWDRRLAPRSRPWRGGCVVALTPAGGFGFRFRFKWAHVVAVLVGFGLTAVVALPVLGFVVVALVAVIVPLVAEVVCNLTVARRTVCGGCRDHQA